MPAVCACVCSLVGGLSVGFSVGFGGAQAAARLQNEQLALLHAELFGPITLVGVLTFDDAGKF